MSFISFTGLQTNGQGAAVWNTGPGAAEPQRSGHRVPASLSVFGLDAYYYLASRDYVDPQSTGGIQFTSDLVGFDNLTAALSAYGYSLADLTVQFGLASLGEDIEGQDWFITGDTETRYYNGGSLAIELRGETLVSGAMPTFAVEIDYNDPANFFDDVISGEVQDFKPQNAADSSSTAAQAIAEAFLLDVGNGVLDFEFGLQQPAAQTEFGDGTRVGAYFEAIGQMSLDHGAPSAPFPDFNGDGETDIFWRNTSSGDNGVWLMAGTFPNEYVALPAVSLDWDVQGLADINQDGWTDLFWHNLTTGTNGVWLMEGTTPVGSVGLSRVSTDWNIADVVDFDGDDQVDILWRNQATGANEVWLMTGTTQADSVSLPMVPTDWDIAGAADFDGDDQVDILWRNQATGENGLWLLDGFEPVEFVSLPEVSAEWAMRGVADFNGDGDVDVLWHNAATGANGIWLLTGTTPVDFAASPNTEAGWVPMV